MKRHTRVAWLASLIAIPLATTITTSRDAAWASGCNAATLTGKYALIWSGFGAPPRGRELLPFAGVGLATFDGAGKVSATLFESFNGASSINPYNATYTVKSDCSTVVLTSTNGDNFVCVILNSGAEILCSDTSGSTFTVDLKKQ
jgi:hypothetical protein